MNAKQAITNPYVPPKRPVLVAGRNGLPKLVMTSPDGASAEVYLHGAQVMSWVPAGGSERLFVSRGADFRENAVVRGGIPLAFPRVGSDGRLPRHGFVRTMEWGLAQVGQTDSGAVSATFRLTDSRASWSLWRHRFLLELKVVVGGQSLDLRWLIKNDGQKPFRFMAALQAYLQLADGLAQARLLGLEGRMYRDLEAAIERTDDALLPNVATGFRHFYPNVPGPLLLRDGGQSLQIASSLPDIGLWSPGSVAEALPTDIDDDEPGSFIRLESAVADQSIWLQPGDSWRGRVVLTADEAPPLLPTR